jgi:hypothetical protein
MIHPVIKTGNPDTPTIFLRGRRQADQPLLFYARIMEIKPGFRAACNSRKIIVDCICPSNLGV